MSYNSEPNNTTLTEILAASPNSRQDAITAYFHKASAQHNALMAFTSVFDPNSQNGGVSSIFAEKTELRAGGKSKVHFNTIGLPGGPGAIGAGVLTGNESKSSINTYSVSVDWVRDATSLTEDEIAHIEAGRNLKATLMQLLSKKMGLTKQNHMLQKLKMGATAVNTYRVGNRASTAALTADDTLSIDVSNICRSMLNTLGATPLKKNMSKAGCPISKFLLFATDTAFLPIRNDSLFATAANADVRGSGNANFTGELLDWQGNPFYEFPVTDMAWDDYKGGPLIAKARCGAFVSTVTAENTDSGGATPTVFVDPTNTKSLYFQWFDGYNFQFSRQDVLAGSDLTALQATKYYAWACNPDGSRCFFSYMGDHNGNKLVISEILAAAAGTSGNGATTVGTLTFGTTNLALTGNTVTTLGDEATVPATGVNGAWVYKTEIQEGAIILQANAAGVVYSRSFMLGSMAACFAHGKVKMAEIEQNFDYDFVMGKGYQMIFGTGIALDPLGNPNGYICIEHAIDIVGYACPSYEAVA